MKLIDGRIELDYWEASDIRQALGEWMEEHLIEYPEGIPSVEDMADLLDEVVRSRLARTGDLRRP